MNSLEKDEHKTNKHKEHSAQTLKDKYSDGVDVEFSEEHADHDDKVAQARIKQAEQRNK